MTVLQEIELNRRIEQFRKAVMVHATNKNIKTAQAVADARLHLSNFMALEEK
ncbi:hypothetical protein M5F04_11655 [Acinetobacter sp. ANC 7200]|uniref:hypothetical protein n=1 Tax=Acinetobacter TaxID=469 RepID=UPI0015D2E56B|nr:MULTISPECIES: hypothetical protein [Acinetobacter]MCL6245189.1 hypothetical protein [Acinetobacter amyesii]